MNEREVSLALADDLFVQCQTLAPWTVNYVDLEESLAVGSIAQEILAQGGILYRFAGLSDAERDERIYQRDSAGWSVSTLSFLSGDHWPDLVAGSYLCAQASLQTVEALMETGESAHEQLGIVHSEQVLHVAHWRRWIALLLGNTETEGEMMASLDGGLKRGSDLMPVGADHDRIHDRWKSAVTADLSAWGVSMTVGAERTSRSSGGEKVVRLLDELRTARSAAGHSNYAIY